MEIVLEIVKWLTVAFLGVIAFMVGLAVLSILYVRIHYRNDW